MFTDEEIRMINQVMKIYRNSENVIHANDEVKNSFTKIIDSIIEKSEGH